MTHPDIETVARAICCPQGHASCRPDCDAVRRVGDKAQAAITAIFDAIAEPTPQMIEQGSCIPFYDDARWECAEVYTTMLRTKRLEILGEGK